MSLYAFIALFISLSGNSFAFEVLDPNSLQLHPVRKCWPISATVQKITYISCLDPEAKKEQPYEGICSNNDSNACDPSKNPSVFTNHGDGQIKLVDPAFKYSTEKVMKRGERRTSGSGELKIDPDLK